MPRRPTNMPISLARANSRAHWRMHVMATAALLALAALVGLAAPPSASADSGTPVGTVVPWGGTALPAGWLRVNGAAVSRATYPELFTAIGTTYGAGDGSTTFNVPDMRQRFPLGKAAAGTGSTLAGTGGAIDHTHSLLSHLHSISADPGHTHSFGAHTHGIGSHNHGTALSGDTMTAGGSHNHQNGGGRFFIVANGSNTLYNLATGGVNIMLRTATTTNGGHSHNFNGQVGTAGTDGDASMTSGSTTPTATGTVGAHGHGGATASTAPGTGSSNPAFLTLDYIIKATSAGVAPCGAVWWSGRATPSTGAIASNATPANRTTQATLFGCLGTTFGAGDGSTTFGLPNLQGRFALGQSTGGTGSVLGSTGGSLDHSHSQSHAHGVGSDGGHLVTLPAHAHSVPAHNHNVSLSSSTDGAHNHGSAQGGSFVGTADNNTTRGTAGTRDYDTPASTTSDGGHTHNLSGQAGSGAADGNVAMATSNSAATDGATAGAHTHGGATNSTTVASTGSNDPAYLALNAELRTAATGPAVGTVALWSSAAAPPAGWMIADGAAVSRTTYASLFGAISTTFGAGNGSTTFNLPNLQGRFALGRATGGTGSVLGEAQGTLDHGHSAGHAHTLAAEANHDHGTINHIHTTPGHHHDFTGLGSNSAGGHNHEFNDGAAGPGNFWGESLAGGSLAVTNVTQGGARNAAHVQNTDTAWGTHKHTNVSGSIGTGANNGNAAWATANAAPTTSLSGGHGHTVGTTDPGTSSNNPAFLTLRYMVRVAPTMTDNQIGDDTWRNTNSGTYDVDAFDPSGVARIETNVWSGAGQTGTQREAWTTAVAPGVASYTTNWSLAGSTWAAMPDGVNYVSARMFNTNDIDSVTLVDTFYVRKDTVAPTDVTAAATSPTVVAPVVGWAAATDATSGVSYYRVFRGSSGTGPWTQINVDGATTGASFTDSAATFGTHYYLVRAVDAAGNVASGGTASGAVTYHRAPDLPVHASPSNGATNTALSPVLTASYADADAHTGTLAYRVCSDAGCGSVVALGSTSSSASGTSPAWTVSTTLSRGVTYYWQVRATDSLGASSSWSVSWSFTTSAGPSIVDNQSGDATWRASNVAAYDVDFTDGLALANFETNAWTGTLQSGTQLQGWTQVSTLSGTSATTNWSLLASTWAALPEGTSYISVRVTNSLGLATTLQDAFSVRKDTVVPANVTASATSPTLAAPVVGWGAATDATSGVAYYRVFRGASGTGPWTQVNVDGATTGTSFTDSAAPFGTHYYLTRAVDAAGNEASGGTASGAITYHRAPNLPVQASPANAATGLSLTPVLTASYVDPDAHAGTLAYRVCSDAGCGSVVASGSTTSSASGTSPAWTVNVSLSSGTTYYWQARATDSLGASSSWTGSWSFTTGAFPSIIDNQAGDATWRATNVAAYDVDFTDAVALTNFETTVWSGTLQSGTQLQGWTQVNTLSGTSATTNWSLLASTWAALPEGTSYVSVRVTNSGGNTTTLQDAFFVRRDSLAPTGATQVSPAAGSAHASWPALTATYVDPAPGSAGQLSFDVCSDAACSAVVQSGTSAAGLTPGTNGSWTPTVATGSYWWRVRGVDSAGNPGPWTVTPRAIQVGSATLDISVPDVALGLVSPNASSVGTATVSVSSNAVNGYQLQVADTSDTVGIGGASNVPDWTGTVGAPSVWPSATYGYFGLSVLDAPGGRDARWGTAVGPFASNDFTNNYYAGLTTTAQTIHQRSGFDPSTENVSVGFRFAPTASTPNGSYSASVTFTVIVNP